MIKFKIGNQQYSIENLRLRDLYAIQSQNPIEIISQLSSAPVSEIRKLRPHQFYPLWESVEKLFHIPANIPVHTEIRLNGNHYGLLHFDEITVGELADIELLTHAPDADSRVHELLAILYRPVTGYLGNVYTIEEYDLKKSRARSKDFLDIELDKIRGATNFFLSFVNQSIKAIKNSLPTENLTPLQKDILELLEPGKTFFTSAQARIHSNLNKHLDLTLEQLSTTWQDARMKPKDLNNNTIK